MTRSPLESDPMPFPTVRSDPWKQGIHPRRRGLLWSGAFWKRLCETGAPLWAILRTDHLDSMRRQKERLDLSPECVAMIAEMNCLLYGSD